MQTATVTTIGTSPINFSLSVNPNVVTLNTAQTISGAKTFTSSLDLLASTITVGSPRTDAVTKSYRFTMPNYNNADGLFCFNFSQTTAVANSAYIGGGVSVANAATNIYVYAAANTTTPAGSMVADFTISGFRLGAANSRVTTILNDATMAANSATSLATQQSIKGYVDAQNTSGTWTPTISFTTPGNLSVSYAVQTGTWSRSGNIITVIYGITFTPTFTTASGVFLILGFPVASAGGAVGSIYLNSTGITFPSGRTDVCQSINNATSTANILFSGSAVNGSVLPATSIASGTAITLTGTITYKV